MKLIYTIDRQKFHESICTKRKSCTKANKIDINREKYRRVNLYTQFKKKKKKNQKDAIVKESHFWNNLKRNETKREVCV